MTTKHTFIATRGLIICKFMVLWVFIFSVERVYGQQYPSYTQYALNKFIFNPAAAGMDGYTAINIIAREQWVGFEGTPKTHAFTLDSRILGNSYILKKLNVRKNKPVKTHSGNMAWGMYFYSDLNGPIDKISASGTYAYHIDMGSAQLSLGLAFMFSQLKIQEEELIFPDDIEDPLLTGGKQAIWITDANFGAYYVSKKFYAGYSTLQLMNSSIQFGEKGAGEYKLTRHHAVIFGYKYYAANRILVEPSFMLKTLGNFRVQGDFTAKATYDERYWAGLNLRTGSSLSAFIGMVIDRYCIGYAFDYNFGVVMKNTFGSHEFIVTIKIGDAARRYRWLNAY